MENDLLNISLRQGKQFNKYQSKKYFKEGFVSYDGNNNLLKQEQIVRPVEDGYVPVINKMNELNKNLSTGYDAGMIQLEKMKIRYNLLLDKYKQIHKTINTNATNGINRVSSNNPYLNKLVKFTTGELAYVTNQGVLKPIASDILDSLSISKTSVNINMPWNSSYNIEGTVIPSNPSLISGTPMKKGQHVGNEGQNVYVSSLLSNDIAPSYFGCYKTIDNMEYIGNKPPSSKVEIVNGNFDQPTLTNDSYKYINNNSTVSGWGVTASMLNNSKAWGYPLPYPKGNQCISIQKTNNVRQNISLSANVSYTLSFYSCGRDCCKMPNSGNPLSIDLYDQNMTLVKHIYDVTPEIKKWQYYSVVFDVPTDARYRLYISGKTTDADRSSAIQGINIEANSTSGGEYSFEECQELAKNNGYKYFAVQDINSISNKGYCAVSNSEPAITQYGEGFKTYDYVLWSSNTSGKNVNSCYISDYGTINLVDINGNIIWKSSEGVSSCVNGGRINMDSLVATYGANCNGQKDKYNKGSTYTITKGNVTDTVKKTLKDANTMSKLPLTISNDVLGDVAKGCRKSWDTLYQCGTEWKSARIDSAEGQTYIFDCSKESNMCKFVLKLLTNGNMVLTNDLQEQTIWETKTTGFQKNTNDEWKSVNGKYGRNYMKTNENLFVNEWIGSDDGKLKLILESDGNLVLYTSEVGSGCSKINNIMYGSTNNNAVYNIGETGYPQNMGILAFVDADSNLKQYPDSMIGFTDNYQTILGKDILGNELTTSIAKTQSDCQTACNNNNNCGAFVYQSSSQTCWLKNKSVDLYSQSQTNNKNTVLGIRNVSMKGGKCGNKTTNINTVDYENYLKGSDMTPDTMCENRIISEKDRLAFENVKSELLNLGKDIVAKMEEIENSNETVMNKFNKKSNQFDKDYSKYIQLNEKIQKEMDLDNTGIEGMQNRLNSNLNGMLSDSDIRLLQENYSYMLWSILAIGILTIAVNTSN